MSGYRRVEPAFCRGCGRTWDPGADNCRSCGEVIVRESTVATDPRVVSRLKMSIIAVSIVTATTWVAAIKSLSAEPSLLLVEGLRLLLCALAILTVGLWYAGGRSASLRTLGPPRRRAVALAAAVAVGLTLPLAWWLGFVSCDLWFWLLTAEAEVLYAGEPMVWVVVLLLGTAFEELLFRGLLFDAVEEIGGARNAFIAVALIFAVSTLSPAYAALGLIATGLRYFSGSVAPAIVFRWVASAVGLGFVFTQLRSA